MKLKPYEKYKPSGIDWIEEIPEEWEVRRVKDVAEVVLGKMLDNNKKQNNFLKSYLKSKNITWKNVKTDSIEKMYFSYNELKRYRLKKGDLLLSEGGEVGKTSIWNEELEECYIQNSVHKITLLRKNNNRYYYYISFSLGKLEYYNSIVNAVSIKHLTREKLIRVFWLSPPLQTQTKIANYLDQKTAQIDKKINLLEQKLTKYEELKKTLINETVCRGLDKTVKLKESGIEWIGKIPKHWEVKRVKEIIRKSHTGWTPSKKDVSAFNGENTWITISDITDKYVSTSKIKISDNAVINSRISKTSKDSLLFSFKLSIGKVAFASKDIYTNEAIISFKNHNKINLNFYYYLFPIFIVINAKENIYGAKLLNQTLIMNSKVNFPPLSEQTQIANYLDEKCTKIDAIKATIKKEIEILKELRKTLINDVVTGKVRVN